MRMRGLWARENDAGGTAGQPVRCVINEDGFCIIRYRGAQGGFVPSIRPSVRPSFKHHHVALHASSQNERAERCCDRRLGMHLVTKQLVLARLHLARPAQLIPLAPRHLIPIEQLQPQRPGQPTHRLVCLPHPVATLCNAAAAATTRAQAGVHRGVRRAPSPR
jgi:hypothetical protein